MRLHEFVGTPDEIKYADLKNLELGLDILFSKLNIDVNITGGHFLTQINLPRNKKPIKISELRDLFKKVYIHYSDDIAKLSSDDQAVLTDLSSKLNVPVVMGVRGRKKTLAAKTIMRKDDFKTRSKQFTVEEKGDE